jgi:hypothetical protein
MVLTVSRLVSIIRAIRIRRGSAAPIPRVSMLVISHFQPE